MASPPPAPPPPPPPAEAGAPIDWSKVSEQIAHGAFTHPLMPAWLTRGLAEASPQLIANYLGMRMRLMAHIGPGVLKAIMAHEEQAQPFIREALTLAIKDLFGVSVDPSLIQPGTGIANNPLGDMLGKEVMLALFGLFVEGQGEQTPQSGVENAERLIGTMTNLSIEGWLEGNLLPDELKQYMPAWGDLDDLLAGNLGLSRLVARALRPLLNATIVEPFTRALNARLYPQRFSDQQLLKLWFREAIGDEKLRELLAENGWSPERAGALMNLAGRDLERSDLAALHELGLVDTDALPGLLRRLGYNEWEAEQVKTIISLDRVRQLRAQLVSVAHDQYRDRVISRQEFEGLLTAARLAPEERALHVTIAELERARPKDLSDATALQAYVEGVIGLERLRAHYRDEGYAEDSQDVLLQLAIKRRLEEEARARAAGAAPGAAPERDIGLSTLEEMHRRGIVEDAELAARYEAEGFDPSERSRLLNLAAQRRAEVVEAERRRTAPPAPTTLSRSVYEEAFAAGVIEEAELRVRLGFLGYSPDSVDLLVSLALLDRRRAEAARARSEATAGARQSKPRA